MKTVFRKALVCVLAGVLSCSLFACGGKSDKPIDGKFEGKNPFTLKVSSYTGGYGQDWLKDLEMRYEAVRMDKTFTVNGVEYDSVNVELETHKKDMKTMAGGWETTNHVYFQEQVTYTTYYRQGNMFEDMTEALTSPNPYEEGKTLESKLSETQKDYYNINGSYYGIPHYAGYVGLSYDIDLFDEWGLYFKEGYSYDGNTNTLHRCFTADDAQKTAGPDGIRGNEDDGLPTTYEEFFMLCYYIGNQLNMTPIVWSGEHRNGYLNWFLNSMVANEEGLEQMKLNYDFSGTATDLVTVSEDGTVTEDATDTVITPGNGYELARQAGKYNALSFLEQIVDGRYYNDDAFENTFSHTNAQDELILGDNDGVEAAMLLDGVWWEMEASSTFAALEQSGMGGKYDRNYGFMPLPVSTKEKAAERAAKIAAGENGYTLLDTHYSLCFIGKGISADEKAIAIDFIQFAYTDESLVRFTQITDTTKAVQYTMTDEQKESLSTFGRSLMNVQEKADVAYSFSQTDFFQNNETRFTDYTSSYTTSDYGAAPADAFKRGTSAKQYFDSMYQYLRNDWRNLSGVN